MDLQSEVAQEGRASYLGASVYGFIEWLKEDVGIDVSLVKEVEAIDELVEAHWEDYLNVLGFSKSAETEKLRRSYE